MTLFAPENTILICPRNGLESQTILGIAEKLGFEVRPSRQSWGAKLEKEPDGAFNNPDKKDFWIVEIPGPERENLLRSEGYTLSVIDHHEYKGLNRSNELSSIEQFAQKCGYELSEEEKLIAANDLGYIWGLIEAGASFDKIREIRRQDLEAQGWGEEDFRKNQQEYDSIEKIISEFVCRPDPVFVHKTTLEKTGYLVDLFHMPNPASYKHYVDTAEGYSRLNLLLIRKGKDITLEFSGKSLYRDLILKQFCPLAEDYYFGGNGEMGFAGLILKSDSILEGIRV